MWATYDMNGVVHLIIANPGRGGKKKKTVKGLNAAECFGRSPSLRRDS